MQERDSNASGRDDEDDEDEGEGFDLGMLRDYLGYAARAVRLHPLLASGVFVTVVSLTFAILRTLPKSYHVETKVLAQKDAIMGQGNPFGSDPMKGSSDLVMAHENLASLVKQLELTSWWREHLAPAQIFKAKVTGFLSRPASEDDQTRTLIDILGAKLNVIQGDGTVTMALDWPSGEMAARILDTAEQNFLETRHVLEIKTIAETISVHEQAAARVRREIGDLTQSEHPAAVKPDPAAKGEAGAAKPAPSPAVASATKKAKRRPELDAELAQQKVMIDTKQRAIADLEQFRQSRLQELQAKLLEERTKYTEQHPIIVGIQQNIAAISKESPQVAGLRAEVKTFQDAYDRTSREAEGSEAAGPRLTALPGAAIGTTAGEISALVGAPHEGRDPAIVALINNEVATYAKILADINAAQIDLDLAQLAFQHRYTILLPPEPPRGPSKPKVPLVMGVAALVAFLLGVFAAVASEVRSGRLVKRWQVQRFLKLPVLAELHLPAGNRPEDRS